MERFREVQYFSWWVCVLLLGVGLVLARAYRVSRSGLPLAFIALIVILTALFLRLETLVSEKELVVSFGWLPVVKKRMLLTEITRVEASSYQPLRDFGGWGWRFGGTHLRRDTFIPQWFQASKAAAASDGHAVHF